MLEENNYEVCFITKIMLFQDILFEYNAYSKEKEDYSLTFMRMRVRKFNDIKLFLH